MKTGTTISLLCLGPLSLAIGLHACDKPSSMYSEALHKRPRMAAPVADGAPAAYIGRWAASPAKCDARPWTLTRDHLQSPDGTACDIVGAEATPAGYSASSMCSGPRLASPTPGRMMLTLTGPAPGNSLSITEGPFGGAVSLVRCAA